MGLFSIFRREKNFTENYAGLVVDMHSHLIPGIDDGVGTLDEAVHLAEMMAGLSFQKLITTPHIMLDGYKNTPEIIKGGLEQVQNALDKKGLSIPIEAAAEYFFDEGFERLINKGELLTFGNNYVLFEISFINRPAGLEQLVFQLQAKGYKPVLAHPERYPYLFTPGLDEYQKLKESGLFFQINIPSIAGAYSPGSRNAAQKLIDSGMVDFIASDLHNAHQLLHLHNALKEEHLSKAINNFSLRNRELL